jgi:hypothetical protein
VLWIRITLMRIWIRLITPVADPDSNFIFNVDPDADPDPTFHPDADPDPDHSFQIKAQTIEKVLI